MTKANDGSDFNRMRRRRGRMMAKLNKKSSSSKSGVSINSPAGNAAKVNADLKGTGGEFSPASRVYWLLTITAMVPILAIGGVFVLFGIALTLDTLWMLF